MAQGLHLSAPLILALALACSTARGSPPTLVGGFVLSTPKWSELNAQQKKILEPLGRDWDAMDTFRRQRWLGIAQRYSRMTPEEQARLNERMAPWAHLAPEERIKAREKFKKLQKAPPELRDTVKQKWQEYQNLPDEEKQRLAEQAKTKAALSKAKSVPPSSKFTPPPAPPLPAAAATSVPTPLPSPLITVGTPPQAQETATSGETPPPRLP